MLARALIEISHEYSLWQDLSVGTNMFDPVTLTLEFGLLFENFHIADNLSTVSARVFIIHMNIPWDKIF